MSDTAVMEPGVIIDPALGNPEVDWDRQWHVIVANDDHNTFEGVTYILSKTIPGVDSEEAFKFAMRIHEHGHATVWSGEKELAEHYWEQLSEFGLTMKPLEQDPE